MNRYWIYWRRIAFLFYKELLTLIKDPANRVILFAPALIQSILFGYGATYDLNHVPYAVVDQSRSAMSQNLLAELEGSGVFQRQATLQSSADIAKIIDAQKVLMVLTIPSDFEKKLSMGQASPVQLILDGRNSTTAGLASAQFSHVVQRFNQQQFNTTQSINIERRSWFNPNMESRWNIMPALIAALSMMQTFLLAALSVAREREQGTFDQLLVTPLSSFQILLGKALPAILVGLLQSTIILIISVFWFQIPLNGSLLLLYAGLFCFTLASVGMGLSVSAFSNTMQQAMLYTFVVIMPLILLSGMVTPVSNMPQVLQIATYANPLRFGIEITRRVYLEGAQFSDIAINFIPMLAVAAITLPFAAWLFRKKL